MRPDGGPRPVVVLGPHLSLIPSCSCSIRLKRSAGAPADAGRSPPAGRARPASAALARRLDAIDDDPDAEPAHPVRFGAQVKAKGVDPGTRDAERTIGYITKYVTKSATDCHQATSDPQRAHLDRLWHELRVTPCSERYSKWLLYGVQPKKAHGRLQPGHCKGRVHQKTTLGIGGRRVLVSRDWSGKTLTDHRTGRN
ncbi:hypothetical protein Ait01nite_065550 [Actinoplanes italicus]|uniref:Uncharacterized protein n=1 Tax=Actinoplanes italicus TaxID=113567 RepID=A0A2T0KQB6_9ACTN|nr:hypothetical protein CLV67_101652 [Actinoplanes italicus]GIE33510.1 hypothetical protein Ait01nite_065550 [Actinoplanes italicus]